MSSGIEKFILSWPTSDFNLSDASGNRWWIQLAKTGSFVSPKYGKFSITKQDLSDMVRNFADVHPLHPTQLPIDYDHLSMDPKKPGDGVAAGWLNKIELRGDGSELWGEVDWTKPGADRVRAKEYRYISPSFVKGYVSKAGKQVGTTLLAAAVTNHPFLEGMQAIMLSDKPDFFKKEAEKDPKADVAVREGEAEDVEPKDSEAEGEQVVDGKDEADAGDQQIAAIEAAIEKIAPGMKSRLLDITDTIATWRQGDQTFRAQFNAGGNGGAVTLGTPEPVTVTIAPVQPQNQQVAPNVPPQAAPAPASPMQPVHPTVPAKPVTATHLSDKGEPNMSSKLFTLSDNEGKEVQVSEDALRAAFAQIDPDADADKAKIVSLSAQVEALAGTIAANDKAAREFSMNTKLDGLMKQGRISKPQREWAFNLFAADQDATKFDAWVATLPEQPIIRLNHNHGTGGDVAEPTNTSKSAAQQIMARAKELVAAERIDLRDAVIRASAELPESLSEQYREGYAEFSLRDHQ